MNKHCKFHDGKVVGTDGFKNILISWYDPLNWLSIRIPFPAILSLSVGRIWVTLDPVRGVCTKLVSTNERSRWNACRSTCAQESWFHQQLGIRDILVRIRMRIRILIRILGSVPLTNGSGCRSYGSLVYLHLSSKIKSHKEVTKQ